jgi:hypothetical protein
MIYTRESDCVFFLFPAIAFGHDQEEGRYFFLEVAWMNYALGFSNKPNE